MTLSKTLLTREDNVIYEHVRNLKVNIKKDNVLYFLTSIFKIFCDSFKAYKLNCIDWDSSLPLGLPKVQCLNSTEQMHLTY